jgi:hypothetical protein
VGECEGVVWEWGEWESSLGSVSGVEEWLGSVSVGVLVGSEWLGCE